MNSVLTMLGILAVLISAICAFLIIKLPKQFWVKFVTIPLVLLLGFSFAINLNDIWGYPYHGLPQGKFQIQDYRVVFQRGADTQIEVWVLQKRKSRLYTFAYNKEVDQKFGQALREQRSGNGFREFQFNGEGQQEGQGEGNGKQPGGDGVQPAESMLQSEHKETQINIPLKL